MRVKHCGLALALILSMADRGMASFTTFLGFDTGANQADPRPNSNSAASSFLSAVNALGGSSTITFETAPVGAFAALAAAPGVTITGADDTGANQTIRNTPFPGFATSLVGYNTTTGGSNFLYAQGGTVTFTFNQGIQYFGMYISGIQGQGEVIQFDDGTAQALTLPTVGNSVGGILYVGFIDTKSSIRSVTLNTLNPAAGTQDFVGLDDATFGVGTSIPEPSSLALCAIAGAVGMVIFKARGRAVS